MAALDQIAQYALSSRATLEASYDIARSAIDGGIPGDFVECGVFAGAQSAAMAMALRDAIPAANAKEAEYGGCRRVHLFDSFTGIPQAGEHDTEFLEAGHKPGLSACSLEQVRANMRAWGIPDELLVYHEGLFRYTLPIAVDANPELPEWSHVKRIAVLRLDGDLYESTAVCLDVLYPLVSPGGWVICDDFQLSGARKALLERVNPGPVYWRKE